MIIKRISYSFALLFILIETISLTFIFLFNTDTSSQINLLSKVFFGFINGFLTIYLMLFFVNLFLSKSNYKIKKIRPLQPSLINGSFLSILFLLESIISPIKSFHLVWGNAIASISTPISLAIILFIYDNLSVGKISFDSRTASKSRKTITKNIIYISLVPIVLFSGLYEFVALPLMAIIQSLPLFQNLGGFALSGFVAGTFSVIVIKIYNSLDLKLELKT